MKRNARGAMTTTKRDLARMVAQEVWCSFPEALELVEAVFAGMREQLIAGNRIEVRGFGVLEVREMAARPQARNPRTGEVVYVPARRRVHFRPGKALQEALHAQRPEGD
jgi:nucleoid DNA-binding protein